MTKHPEVVATMQKISDRAAMLPGFGVVVCETWIGHTDAHGDCYFHRYVDPETLESLKDKKTGKELFDPKTRLPLSAFFPGKRPHQSTAKERRDAGYEKGLHEVRTGK